jgi:hypothetical protein
MNVRHRLRIEADNGREVLFVCPETDCGRRVVVNRSGDLVVLVQGDFLAFHSGGTAGLQLGRIQPEQRESA